MREVCTAVVENLSYAFNRMLRSLSPSTEQPARSLILHESAASVRDCLNSVVPTTDSEGYNLNNLLSAEDARGGGDVGVASFMHVLGDLELLQTSSAEPYRRADAVVLLRTALGAGTHVPYRYRLHYRAVQGAIFPAFPKLVLGEGFLLSCE